jgi:S-adenosylmethionine synthetase
MERLIVSSCEIADETVEVVERKGLGHPDTICDALAENFSRNLCQEYRRRFGEILHHNVDKALLCGGRASPAFGGGSLLAPISIYLAGRAVTKVGQDELPIEEIAVEGSKAWLEANLSALDAKRHVEIHALVRPGSKDLRQIFSRKTQGESPLANDTSIGVGYAPMSPLERLVLAIERRISGRPRSHPAWGEDVKVMGVRCDRKLSVTVACAMIGGELASMNEYLAAKAMIADLAREAAREHEFAACDVGVNVADNPAEAVIFLTVTGTSAEAGDDGQVGRGNRINGLITPCRPMTLEAAAGKNPVSHVGKIYNVVAREIAEMLVASNSEIVAAQCFMVSRIGQPLTNPALLQVKMATRDGVPAAEFEGRVNEVATNCLSRLPILIDDFVAGAIEIF